MICTGKTLCKYRPVFAPYLHDWSLYGINTVQNGSVFTWHFSCDELYKAIATIKHELQYIIASYNYMESYYTPIDVTKFGKMCMRSSHIQFFNFGDSKNLAIWIEVDVILSEILEPLFSYHPWKSQICILFPVVFMNLQMSKWDLWTMHIFPNLVTSTFY